MSFKKIAAVAFSLLLFTCFAFSQSLVEAAKKEKERRASLKERKRVVATNAEITGSRKRTATSISRSDTQIPAQERISPPRTESERRPSTRRDETDMAAFDDENRFRQRRANLEEKWKKSQEYSDLLATKMNGLWQEFYNLGNDMIYRGKIQADISETYVKLQRSQEEEAKFKQELDAFLEEARRQGVPPGWLR